MSIEKQSVKCSWYTQTALNLHQFMAWIMLRDPLAVERIGDQAGQDASNQYSTRDLHSRNKIFGAEIAGASQIKVSLPVAVVDAKKWLSSGTIESSARACAADSSFGPRLPISKVEWQSIDFDLNTGGAFDQGSGHEWVDLRFPTAKVIEIWPGAGFAVTKPTSLHDRPISRNQKNSGGRPPKWDWDEFWIEIALWAAQNDLVPEDLRRQELKRHIMQWFANRNPDGDTPSDSDVRRRLSALFDRSRQAMT